MNIYFASYWEKGYFEEDVLILFTYGTLKRRSHFYEDVADSIHMLQRRSGFHAIFTKTQPKGKHFNKTQPNPKKFEKDVHYFYKDVAKWTTFYKDVAKIRLNLI